ncbi:MAG: sigma-70 family RNA polymerase sigma factor, partial [Verrucomicrobia subdivision 3 bacterium]|nr:sigma-70 family RNA polymerase sigma factor [Limisphaerales bacterium]
LVKSLTDLGSSTFLSDSRGERGYVCEMTGNDLDLLREYTQGQSQDAFASLVRRHLDLVYCAALRQVRSPQLAEEVAQSVFMDLARHARKLKSDTVLSAWLYEVTRRTAISVVRGEARRQLREQIATQMNAINAAPSDWAQIEPLLDEAMHALDQTDRTAVLLRYFENKSLREVGRTLGTSDDAAQKRVSRAVERLRAFFSKRGVTVGASGLAMVISAHAVHAAPVGLSGAVIATASVAGVAVSTATPMAAANTSITMTTMQKTLVATTLIVAVSTGVYEARKASALRSEVARLEQQQAPLLGRIEALKRERDQVAARQAALQAENEQLRQAVADVPTLRGEVARLRARQQDPGQAKAGMDMNDPSVQQFLAARAQAQEIARYLKQMPDKTIPELKLLTDIDWLAATKEARFDSDADVRATLSRLRVLAKNRIPLGDALHAFINANNGQLPAELAQLKPYLKSSLGDFAVEDNALDAMLQRYVLLRTGMANEFPEGTWFIAERAPVDEEYDTRAKFGNGTSTIIATGLHSAGDPDDPTY